VNDVCQRFHKPSCADPARSERAGHHLISRPRRGCRS
jgi:hypothetical protein